MTSSNRIGQGFDVLAPIYDCCVRLVFGSKIYAFQEKLVSKLQASKKTLIIGGGSGLVLKQCLDIGLSAQYVYQELSGKMIEATRARLTNEEINLVQFIHGPQVEPSCYDTIILPFILDCYSDEDAHELLKNISSSLNDRGEILCIDFSNEKPDGTLVGSQKRWFIGWLYVLFQQIAGIKTSKLPNISNLFSSLGFSPCYRDQLFDHWVVGSIYQKEIAI